MAGEPIRSVIVAGDGIVAWSAAAALKHRVPHLAVAVVAAPSMGATSDLVASTLPSILDFHRDLGLGEENTIVRAGSSFRLGVALDGWNEGGAPFVHAYGEYGRPFGTTSFHLHWIRLQLEGKAPPFDSHCGPAAMGRAGRFLPPRPATQAALGAFGFGLRLDLPRYREMIRAYALHLGTVERRCGISGVRLRDSDGFIAALRLDDGSEAQADLFVDCTGPAARIRSALDDGWEDWSRWLPCDRLVLAHSAAVADPDPLDRATAIRAGWRWRSEGLAATSHGMVYASHHMDDESAAQALAEAGAGEPSAPLGFESGCRPEPWLRNCVAVGESAVSVEPLEWTNLHLAHNAIDRIVSMMPDRDCDRVELANYNREALAEARRVRDFLALHYLCASRHEPFWREAASIEPPASLGHSLNLFRERGRLPYYEEETFARDSWLAVLLGLGVIPRRTDPLIDSVQSGQAEQAMARMRAAIGAIVPNLPTQAAFLRNLTRPATR